MVATGCTEKRDGVSSHPPELVGKWARRDRKTGELADTLEFRADGSLVWARRYGSSPNGEWLVKADALGSTAFCARDGREASCQNYRIAGDTLRLGGGPAGATVFERVR